MKLSTQLPSFPRSSRNVGPSYAGLHLGPTFEGDQAADRMPEHYSAAREELGARHARMSAAFYACWLAPLADDESEADQTPHAALAYGRDSDVVIAPHDDDCDARCTAAFVSGQRYAWDEISKAVRIAAKRVGR